MMTKSDYLDELRRRLVKLPAPELNDAIQFYTEYFEDAGDDAAAMDALGSPARLAAQITAEYSARQLQEQHAPAAPKKQEPYRSDYAAMASPSQAYTVQTYAPPQQGTPPPVSPSGYRTYEKVAAAPQPQAAPSDPAQSPSPYTTPQKKNALNWIWYVILGISSLIAGFPLAIVALVLIVVVIAVAFALIVAFIAVIVSLIAAGFYVFFAVVTGAIVLTWESGLLTLGSGIILLGLALLLIPLLIRFVIWLVRGIGKLCTSIFNRINGRKKSNEKP